MFFSLSFTIASAASKRVALVIGNSTYEHSTPLINPKNDAIAISKALREVGFDVITAVDTKYRDLPKVLSEFDRKLRSADVGLLYYSGHGMQIEGQNYLVPVDANVSSEIDVQFQTVRLDRILNVMQTGPRITLVFLDACRDNPISRRLARTLKTRSSIIGRGLARIRAHSGMMVAYATAPGDVARDGKGTHSPFTSAMLNHIKTPDLDISRVLRRVRRDVMQETGQEQVPWTNSSLTYDFVFNPTKKTPPAGALDKAASGNSTGSQSKSLKQSALTSEQYAWNATTKIGTCGAYKHFRKSYATSFYAGLAQSWMDTNCPKVDTKSPAAIPAKVQPPIVTAMLPKIPPPSSPARSLPDKTQLARQLQSELKRLGCLSGKADGIWGAGSRRAVDEFNRVASNKIAPDEPSLASINTLKSVRKSTCQMQPESAHNLPGKWSCRIKTQAYLTKAIFPLKKGKEVATEKCRAEVTISEFDGSYYWLRQAQNCRKNLIFSVGKPEKEYAVLKSKLWYKGDQLLGKVYKAPKRMVQPGWNPIAHLKVTDSTLKMRADGVITIKGVDYRFKTRAKCSK